MNTHIYILRSPLEDNPRYIGLSKNTHVRYIAHVNDKSNTHKVKWISSLMNQGLNPVMEIIDTVPFSESAFWEMHYISLYKSWGFKLTNGTIGGDGAHGREMKPVSEETRAKLSVSGKKNAKSWSAKMKKNGVYKEAKRRMSGLFNPMKNPEKSLVATEKRRLKIRKPVVQIDRTTRNIIKEWDSIVDAANSLSISPHAIGRCCNKIKNYNTSGGFIWEYKKNVTNV